MVNAPATFERLMENVLHGLQWDICLVYLDDIIVMAKDFEGMIENMRQVFGRLQDAGLKLKPKKCCMFAEKVHFLEHVISESGVGTDPDKIECIKTWPIPQDVNELRSFLGLCSYYRRYVKWFSDIVKCLHQHTEKGRKFVWTNESQEAFEKLKSMLVQAPILVHPYVSKEFILDTDASNKAIGRNLSEVIDGREQVIAYASRTLSKT